MPLAPISLGLKSNPARYGHAGAARLINCYAEQVGEEGKAPWNLHACDGFDLFSTLTGGGAVRAMLALTDADLYVVAGRQLFRVDATGTATPLGGIPSDGLVTMARNRVATPQIAIVCDGLYYICQGGVLTQMADPDLPPPTSVTSLSGYFVFQLEDGRMFASELDDEDVESLSFATAASNPDGGVRAWTRGRDLVSGGRQSIEFWQDTGAANFPFERVTAIDVGVLAAASVADVDQTSAFVAHDGTVRVLQGYQAQRISTHAVERFIDGDDPDELEATSWQARGHTFYALSGSTGTWVYDATTQLWHERQSYDETRWRISRAVSFGHDVVLGDYEQGKLYTLNASAYTEAGSHLVMTVQTPPVHAEPYRVRHNALFVDVVPGVGLVSATASLANPQIMMDYSDDGGANWSTQRMASLGTAGDRLRRVRFNRLGMTRSRTYRLSVSAAVARSVIGASLDLDRLAA